MPSPLLDAIHALDTQASQLRDRVNHGWRREALIKSAERWNTICSAMDAVGDTCSALAAYCRHLDSSPDDKGLAYLVVYGVLHALYLQQDAVFWWCRHLDVESVCRFNGPGR